MPAATVIKADRIFGALDEGGIRKYILLDGGIIEDISDILPQKPHLPVVDFSGFVVTPFLCDYHLHFPHSTLGHSNQIAETLLHFGISRVFDGGDRNRAGAQMKGLLKDRIEVKTAGYAIYKEGSYGKFIGKAVRDFGEAKALIDELCAMSTDYIKIINSGIFDPEADSITDGGFDRQELVDIVGCARDMGLDVFCHVNGDERIRDAVDAGVSAIIHGLRISTETLSIMAQMNIAFIPTVKAFDGLSGLSVSPAARTNIERAVAGHLLAIKYAADRGVRVLPGSDSGPKFLPYGKAFHEELALFKRAGLSDEYIISSALAGRLIPGMKADFLVLKGTHIVKIFLGGECLEGQ